jgi:hypothetical protein
MESNLNIIPKRSFQSVIEILNKIHKSIAHKKYVSTYDVIKNLNYLAKYSIDVKSLTNKHTETLIIVNTEVHIIVVYLILVCKTIFISIFFKFRFKKVMYKPDLVNSQTDTGRDVATETR